MIETDLPSLNILSCDVLYSVVINIYALSFMSNMLFTSFPHLTSYS